MRRSGRRRDGGLGPRVSHGCMLGPWDRRPDAPPAERPGDFRGETVSPQLASPPSATAPPIRSGPDVTFTRSRGPRTPPRACTAVGGASLRISPGQQGAEGAGRGRPRSQWAGRAGARRAGRGGASGAARPMGWARGGAGRGVGALVAARWPPSPFGPGGGIAEPVARTFQLFAPPLRSAPAAPP